VLESHPIVIREHRDEQKSTLGKVSNQLSSENWGNSYGGYKKFFYIQFLHEQRGESREREHWS
jgi:hypothetical protein